MVTIGSTEPARRPPAAGASDTHQRSPRRSVDPRLLVAVLLVLLLGTLLMRPGGRRLGDDTEHVVRSTTLPFLADGATLTQRFEAQADGLSQVMIRFATADELDGCEVQVRVRSATAVVGVRDAACSAVPQDEIFAVDFPPVASSDGDDFEVEVALSGTGTGPITLWGGNGLGTLPAAELDGHALDVSAELHSAYGDDGFAWEQIGRALDRIDGYGPFWHHPLAVVAMAVGALVCLVLLVRRGGRFALALVITFAAVKGLLWSTVLPPMEGPDEHAHFAYAQFMVEQHRIPRRDENQLGFDRPYSEQLDLGLSDVFHLWSQWPGNRPDYSPAARARARDLLADASRESGGSGAAAGYSPYYYVPAAALYWVAPTSIDDRLAAMRLWSVALGALAVWLAVLIGRRLFPTSEAAALALGVAAAAQPMLSQQTAIVNNDGLVIVAGFVSLLVALDLATPGARPRLLLIGGLASGLALATKPFGIAWAPVLAVAWLIGRLRTAREERRPWTGDVVRAGAGVAATYGLWIAMSVALHLPATAVQTFNPEPGPKTLRRFWDLHMADGLKPFRDRWIEEFWGNFGQLTLPLPHWVLSVLTTAGVLTLLALVWWICTSLAQVARRRWSDLPADELTARVHLGLCALAVVTTLAVLHAADFLQFRHNGRLELLQGRYALMVLPAALALPALLLQRLSRRPWAVPAMVVIAGGVVALNVASVTLVVERYYL